MFLAGNAEDLNSNWWFDVYCKGMYPVFALKYYERLGIAPVIEDGDLELLSRAKTDFIGINYYQTATVAINPLDGVGAAEGTDYITTRYTRAQGLFVAIIVGLLVGELMSVLLKSSKLEIKMPD